ncbi:MAG: septal ring lytic transglycosylase RlpA family protein [Spirochaetaceae bacterium]|jgi:rare lipoprotein A|nr:septal ring lytic transglycosylase RlpA family protein [Spirochaetaceae bacterium]
MKKIIAVFACNLFVVMFAMAQTQPLPENGGFQQEGQASWYGAEFAGRPTASGEIFDPGKLTAAHLTLPFGTVLTVTNILNNTQVQVKVNDRGPFAKSRIIDVSRAAAEQLGMVETGTAHVRIEIAPRSAAVFGASANTSNAAEAPVAAAPSTNSTIPDEAPDYYPFSNPASEVAGGSDRYPVPSQAVPQATVQGEAASPTQIQPVRTASAPTENTPTLTVNPGVQVPYQPLPPSANAQVQAPVVPPPVYPGSPAGSSSPQSTMRAPPMPVIAVPPNQNARYAPAEIRGGPIVPGRTYRLQIGSFKQPKNAVDTFERLSNAGLNPSWETFEGYYRIVLTNIKAEDIPSIAAKLGNAGYKEAIARLEA